MARNIEMNYKDSSAYEVLYPKNISDIVLASQELQNSFELGQDSYVDDALLYLQRKMILIQYNKAGINVTVKSAGGSPLEGVPIPNITANYDGTGEVVTDSQGKAFGYCDAGSISIAPVNCADVTYTNQSVQALASEMYDVEITGTVVNFQKYTSSTSVRFSKNVESLDVNCGGGGGAGADYGNDPGGGGGGGYSVIQEGVSFIPNNLYSCAVGSGGYGNSNHKGNDGSPSSFCGVTGNGGMGGYEGTPSIWEDKAGDGGIGNGNGQDGGMNYQGGLPGTQNYFETFEKLALYGGGGAGGIGDRGIEQEGGAPGGGSHTNPDGKDGLGGGGAGASEYDRDYMSPGNGGSGVVCIRMHLKVTS